MSQDHRHEPDTTNGTKSRATWAFIGFAAIAAYFLVAEHKAHLSGYLQYWPLLLVLACPLLHMFMHGGHGHGGNHDRQQQGKGDKRD